jgi:probable rRNA maturation factor
MASINFFSEEIIFKLKNKKEISNWIKKSIEKEGRSLECVNFIFCSDQYLLKINTEYLNHNTLTDIITFDQSNDLTGGLEADIYISIDRVKENASQLEILFDEEICRVIIHGILHLMGYTDKDEKSRLEMRKKEDAYLLLRN